MEEKNILQVSLYLSIERYVTTGFKLSIWLTHNYQKKKKKQSYDQPRQHIKKQRHYFVNKGPSSQGYGFSISHLWMWELNYKPELLCPWNFPGKDTGAGCCFLLQGIFLTQGLNPCLWNCRQILYQWATWEAQRDNKYMVIISLPNLWTWGNTYFPASFLVA